MPSMKMTRVILFTAQIDAMSRFYGEVLGLKQLSNERGWREFAAGGASIALHSGAEYVAALRQTLLTQGAKFGKVRQGEVYCLCDAKDPDGNPIQLSNR